MAKPKLEEVIALNDEAIQDVKDGRPAEAVRKLMPLVDRGLEHYPIFNTLGMAFLEKRNPSDAIKYFSKALAQKLNLGSVHANLGFAHSDLGDVDGAIFSYRKAVELGFCDERFLKTAILFCEKHGRYEDLAYISEKSADFADV